MAYTYSANFKGYFLNDYLHKKLGDNMNLVTTRHGGWVILNDAEFGLLRHGKAEESIELYNLLKQEGIIVSEEDIDRIANFYKERCSHLLDGTTLHIITPTLRCNQKCVYCYASSKPVNDKRYDMTEETAKAVVDFIFQCPAKGITIEFQGGEPLLNFPVLKFIVDYAKKVNEEKKKNVTFRLVTNLTLMDDEKLEYLLKNNIALNSSFDGSKHVHDCNRKYDDGRGTYDDVMKQIKLLKEKGVAVSYMPTITRYSLPHYKEIIDEYLKLGLNRFWARRMNMGGFAVEKWKEIGYTPEEFLDFWKKCVEYIIELNKKGTFVVEGYMDIVLKNILFSKKYNGFVCMASPCGCAWGQTAYNYKGDIYTCDEARSFEVFKLGNVKETTYKELYSSLPVVDVVDLSTGLSFDCYTCAYHPFCGPCIVDNYGEFGNIIQKPNNYNCKIKKGMMDYIFTKIIPDKEKFEIIKKWVGIGRVNSAPQAP